MRVSPTICTVRRSNKVVAGTKFALLEVEKRHPSLRTMQAREGGFCQRELRKSLGVSESPVVPRVSKAGELALSLKGGVD